jgi:hypothetical protein
MSRMGLIVTLTACRTHVTVVRSHPGGSGTPDEFRS